jgi:hypothetical protein
MDDVFWRAELGRDKYKFRLREKYFEISIGRFGINKREKYALSLFYHADERQLTNICEIPTIDISFDIDVRTPRDISKEWEEYSIANSLVEAHIPDAFHALNRFIDSYRDNRYPRLYRRGAFIIQAALVLHLPFPAALCIFLLFLRLFPPWKQNNPFPIFLYHPSMPCPKTEIFFAIIYWYFSLLFPLLYSQHTLVVLSCTDEHDRSLCLFLYIPTRDNISLSLGVLSRDNFVPLLQVSSFYSGLSTQCGIGFYILYVLIF